MTSLPTIDQLLQVEPTIDQTVPPEFIDENGHMNIRHYFELGGTGTWGFTRTLGITPAYIAERGLSTYTAEQHLRYFSELREGERVTVHPRLLDASGRVLHLATSIVDRTNGRLACLMEAVLIHVDLSTRRPAPFPDDVQAAIDKARQVDRTYAWTPPISGSMGVRR